MRPFARITKAVFIAIAIVCSFLLTLRAERLKSAPGNTAIAWDSAALQGIRDAKLGAPVVARALAIVHTCMYDAWSAYDERAIGTQLGGALRRPASERTLANKEQAISSAAYRALIDVLPVDTNSVYIPLMKQLGYDPNDDSTDIETPTGMGGLAPINWPAQAELSLVAAQRLLVLPLRARQNISFKMPFITRAGPPQFVLLSGQLLRRQSL